MDYTHYFYTTRYRATARKAATLLAPLAVLILLLAFLAPPSHAQIAGEPETDDRFGSAVAVGDFNNDGFDDVAIGAEGEDDGAGVVHVIYGTASRLDEEDNNFFFLTDRTNLAALGASAASGDFNGDGFDDVAVGMPDYDSAGRIRAGGVLVLFGAASGLTTTGALVLTQTGNSGDEANDRFGFSVAAGDFDGDGRDDLAIGIPGEDLDGPSPGAGAISVRYGTGGGFGAEQVWHQDMADVPGSARTGDQFGFALAAGDFDGNGRDDLAVGVPGSNGNTGAMIVFDGGNGGLFPTNDGGGDWNQNDLRPSEQEAGDQFGYALAAGDFNNDGRDDIAVGIPFEDNEGLGVTDNGRFAVFYGSTSGVSGTNQLFGQSQLPNGTDNKSETGDLFGSALAAGDFTGDGIDDLAIGSPGESVPGGMRSGMVFVLHGSSDQLVPVTNQIWDQGNLQPRLNNEDMFGMEIAAGDFNGDGRDDLIVGVPLDDGLPPLNEYGVANVIYGRTGGLNAAGNQFFFQGAALTPTSGEDEAATSALFALDAAFPNPFTEATQLRFTLATADHARLAVYDLLGREVAVLVDEVRAAGAHAVAFEAAGLPAGLYVVRLSTDAGEAQTRRITVVR
ncbi:MAG: T9SS type A sorting domain-containing protein [Bacteroidota bacterium]